MGSQRKQPRSSVVTAKPSSDDLPVPAPPERQERIPLAIFFMVSAGAIFSFSSAASKLLAETYPVGEVLFSRVLVSLVLFSAFALPTAGIAVFRTKRPAAHVLRSMSQFTSQTLLLIAFTLMPLASATAINFSAPLFAALASLIFLKEPIGPARWVVLLIGFAGVLIVTNPGAETFQIGALFALANAVLFGTVTAGVRGMTSTESAKTLTMYQLLLLTLFYGMTLPFAFKMPVWADVPLIVANGVDQHARPVLVDALAASGADIGGGAVPISLADLGDDVRLRAVGRRADHRVADRLGHRCRLGPVPDLAQSREKGNHRRPSRSDAANALPLRCP